MSKRDLVRKGLRNPGKVPVYLLGRVFPDSQWAPEYRHEDGFVTFDPGGFAGGSPDRPELSARIYHEVAGLSAALGDAEFERSLEIGCGYGRLSGWIADLADEAVAIEPNTDAVGQAGVLYPGVGFAAGVADSLPFPDDSFDLVVSWVVLSHVRSDAIGPAAAELTRVLRDDGTLLAVEHTTGEPGPAVWPRSVEEYDRLFEPLSLTYTADRGAEPTFDYASRTTLMKFEA